jgi:hypothetical protein
MSGDPIAFFQRAAAAADATVSAVRPGQFDHPTPCPEWIVRQEARRIREFDFRVLDEPDRLRRCGFRHWLLELQEDAEFSGGAWRFDVTIDTDGWASEHFHADGQGRFSTRWELRSPSPCRLATIQSPLDGPDGQPGSGESVTAVRVLISEEPPRRGEMALLPRSRPPLLPEEGYSGSASTPPSAWRRPTAWSSWSSGRGPCSSSSAWHSSSPRAWTRLLAGWCATACLAGPPSWSSSAAPPRSRPDFSRPRSPPLVFEATALALQIPHYLHNLQDRNSGLGKLNVKYHIQDRLAKLITNGGGSLVCGVLGAGKLVLSTRVRHPRRDGAQHLLPGRPDADQGVRLQARAALAAAAAILIGDEILAKVGGYVLGNFITSVIVGLGT